VVEPVDVGLSQLDSRLMIEYQCGLLSTSSIFASKEMIEDKTLDVKKLLLNNHGP
jgi:hypothetical protein